MAWDHWRSAALLSLLLTVSCDSRSQGPTISNAVVAESDMNASPPPPPPPPPPPNYAPAIEAVVAADKAAGGLINRSHLAAMRAIDMARTPIDFRQAYLEHIFAWERRVKDQEAWDSLTADANTGPVIWAGIACKVLDCATNPIDTRIEAEDRLKEEMAAANEAISATYRDVQRLAVRYGANPSPPLPGTGNTTGM
jgi:hypothetical protein